MSTQVMWAIQIHRYGGPDQLKLEEALRPAPQAGEVLVRVHAAGVNPIDWQIVAGVMKEVQPVTFPFIPGIEVAGVVEAVGAGVSADLIGQAVLGQITQGAYAEFVSVPVEVLALKPKSLSFIEAAAFPVGATLAWRALFDTAGLTAGQRVLIQAATSGMGVFAVQLAKWKGAQVIATASTAAKLDFVRALGADMVVDSTTTPVERVVQDVDLVLHGGAAGLSSSVAALRRGGTLISNASLGPKEQEQVQAREVRAMTSRGATTVSLERLTQLADEGHLNVPVGKTFALSEVQQAHAYAQSGQGRGRFVLRVVEEYQLIA
jgi:NADPH:quinone reductase-like Zn-dependent oxidoreductase